MGQTGDAGSTGHVALGHGSLDRRPRLGLALGRRRDPGELVSLWRASVERSRKDFPLHDLDLLSLREVRGERFSARWILTHLVEEYGRHAGHADLIREAIDGTTGE